MSEPKEIVGRVERVERKEPLREPDGIIAVYMTNRLYNNWQACGVFTSERELRVWDEACRVSERGELRTVRLAPAEAAQKRAVPVVEINALIEATRKHRDGERCSHYDQNHLESALFNVRAWLATLNGGGAR